MSLGNQTQKKKKKKNIISRLKMNKPTRKIFHPRFPLPMTDVVLNSQLIQNRMQLPAIRTIYVKSMSFHPI